MPEPTNELPEDAVNPDGEEEVIEEGRKGSSRLLTLVLPLVVVCAAGGGFLAYTQYFTLAEAAVSVGLNYGVAEEPENEKEKPIEYGQFTTINDLLINPANSGGKHFLVVSVGMETKSADVIVELDEKDVVIRDAILRLLSTRTSDELASIELRSQIKDEILGEINTILQRGKIDRLYFTQYLLQ